MPREGRGVIPPDCYHPGDSLSPGCDGNTIQYPTVVTVITANHMTAGILEDIRSLRVGVFRVNCSELSRDRHPLLVFYGGVRKPFFQPRFDEIRVDDIMFELSPENPDFF